VKRREIVEEIVALLHERDVVATVTESRHYKVAFSDATGRRKLLVIPKSPGSRDTRRKAVATMRRLLRGSP
jgi:hypothetical protein